MMDLNGLYVQADGDGGDSAHRTGLMAGLTKLTGYNGSLIIGTILAYLEVGPGIYIRHPSYNDPSDFSRDQASRIIFGYAVCRYKKSIRRWLKAMARRWFFHQNGDIMAPGEWRNVIRGLELWWAYPLLLILDLFFIGDVYLRKPWDGVSLYVPDLKFALKKYWTPSAWLANKLNNRTPWLEEALNNHAAENNGCVELQSLFKQIERIN